MAHDGQIVVLEVETQGWNLMSGYHHDKYVIAQRGEVTYVPKYELGIF